MPPTARGGDSAIRVLQEIWQEVLNIKIDDLDANFFDLGGDSLLALAIASSANERGMGMPRSGVLRRPTLRLLAEAVSNPQLFNS